MDEKMWIEQQFEQHRRRLHSVAYRMLGSLSDADDAVQETWLRVTRADSESIDNPAGWLTTVTARVCLNMLRSRNTRREDPLDTHVPDPIVTTEDPEQQAIIADSVGLAMLVVIETLEPAERLAFVLHDMFAVPFDEIAPIVDRTTEAARQLASRARRRVQGSAAVADVDLPRQREVVEAFFAAARKSDFQSLVAVLDPDVVLRSDGGPTRPRLSALVHGASQVAGRAMVFSNPGAVLHPVLVNGEAGVVVTLDDHVFSVIGFTVRNGRIAAIDAIGDPDRLAELDLTAMLTA